MCFIYLCIIYFIILYKGICLGSYRLYIIIIFVVWNFGIFSFKYFIFICVVVSLFGKVFKVILFIEIWSIKEICVKWFVWENCDWYVFGEFGGCYNWNNSKLYY